LKRIQTTFKRPTASGTRGKGVLAAAAVVSLIGVLGASAGVSVAQSDEPIRPIASETNLDPRKVALGDKMFHDKRLSKDNTMSCAGCHNLATGGVDGLPSSIGVGGARGPINAPTVFNSSLNFRQFWDGRAA
jgi:cytochrome c peroxidase